MKQLLQDRELENQSELLALARMLRRSQGKFSLAFSRCNSPAEQQILAERLREILNAFGVFIQEVRLEAEGTILEQVTRAGTSGNPIFVYGLERLLPSNDEAYPVLAELNEKRGQFQKLSCPLVFWLPEYALRQIAERAVDFWAWRSGVYRFESEAQAIQQDIQVAVDGDLWQQASLSMAEKRARQQLLKSLLEDYQAESGIEAGTRARILNRLAFLTESLGDLDGAMQLYQQSLEIKEGLGDL
ncbi:MAG: hypothetical protein ACUVRJ_05680, partial [Candidatus Villigracilaceae bacterium]